MNKTNLKQVFLDMQVEMIAYLKKHDNINHAPSKGGATEGGWLKWFRKYLPSRYKVDSAFIIDCDGKTSDQMDIVIYDTHFCPCFDIDEVKYISAESVYAVFEVKQELNAEEVKYAANKIKSVRSLRRTSAPIVHAGGEHPPKALHRIIGGLLTRKSEWKKVNIAKNLENWVKTPECFGQLDTVCCLDSGTYFLNYHMKEWLKPLTPEEVEQAFIDGFVKGKKERERQVEIKKNSDNEILIHFFLGLLLKLQRIGTVPAMRLDLYANAIDSIR